MRIRANPSDQITHRFALDFDLGGAVDLPHIEFDPSNTTITSSALTLAANDDNRQMAVRHIKAPVINAGLSRQIFQTIPTFFEPIIWTFHPAPRQALPGHRMRQLTSMG
ncbi:hypothetical protein [Qingshengfaniella alkalisoli]|uniref:hypothetical protein n=1 Tax=Qingshengfaniella alkalisoli TaxID=2599296 RepID=UPI00143DF947|nr:hypothetical protein [Qingshengfaniella alkalisoli]